ncbi:SpoIIE family protein phosphatase [Solirubrobacter soli]|uniref:SpoIIE family protein phosphatase n=1 Tax=Solirubrobacter soli TaxID=363832 RepID=UPI00040DB3CA|nr:SpoIIE family protein phosphatase [Solirubrobacter soli]
MGAALKKPTVAVGAAAAVAEALLERRRPAVSRRLAPRERRVESAAAGLFIAVAVVMAVLAPAADDVTSTVLLTVCYALMRRVRFQLGPGLIRPTELVFVPMLFLTPAAAVPLLVAIGALLGELPELFRRRAHPERLLVVIADGWYSIGAALIIAAFSDGNAVDAAWGILLLALAAQLCFDFAASTLREWLGSGISPSELAPVLALVYVIDASLAPIGFLAVLASQVHEHAYLLAIAPGALLGLIARERSGRIAHELALERAFRRSTRALDARAEDLRRQAGRLQAGESESPVEDRAALERMLLTTTIEALQAECGQLSALDDEGVLTPRLTIGDSGALAAAELALGVQRDGALAIAVGRGHVLAVARTGNPFSAVERDLLEHLAAQAAVSLENLRLEELMRRTSAELRAILEGVADAVAAEDPDGHLVYVNAAAARLLGGADELGSRLGIPADLLPGRRVFRGAPADPLVVRHPGESRWSRVKASPVLENGGARLAISVIEDITEIKQAEEAQRFLAESSRALARSLEVEETLPEVARLAASTLGDGCAIHLLEDGRLRVLGASRGGLEPPAGLEDVVARGTPRLWVQTGRPTILAVPILVRDGTAGSIVLYGDGFSEPEIALAEDLGLRIGAAVDNARLYRTRAAIAQTLQQSLLPPELPEIPGLEIAAHYRPAGEGIEVGGDFYDVFSTGEHEWFAVMGDVCGKGAQAAAVTAMVRYTIRAAVMRNRSPAGILRWLNAAMLRQRAGRFVTLAIARFEIHPDGSVIVTVSSGGHPLPRVLRSTGLVEEIGMTGTLLGVLEDVDLEDRVTHLARGDALVLYTDGLTEVTAPKVWSRAHLDRTVAGAHRLDAAGIVAHLAETAEAEAEGPPRDDLALLALRVRS